MLSYLHSFHAGNFADVHKHTLLSRVLAYMGEKAAPYCYLETHAGRGVYDLSSAEARKTGEARKGINKVAARTDAPALIADYIRCVGALNERHGIRHYPGSPKLAQMLSRDRDRLILMEQHTREFPRLKANFRHDGRVAVHNREGYEGLYAMVPPAEKRGVVLIDPDYEVKQEYSDVVEHISRTQKKWPSGIYIVWYPLLPEAYHHRMLRLFERTGIRKILQCELWIRSGAAHGMYGSGLMVINPPWTLPAQMQQIQPWLADKLATPGEGKSRVAWLIGE
ncbi:MAG: 23S rRNA (adenine(2030)-N(6))-methyltransferase RlmJ [Pseudomonadota bacterium]